MTNNAAPVGVPRDAVYADVNRLEPHVAASTVFNTLRELALANLIVRRRDRSGDMSFYYALPGGGRHAEATGARAGKQRDS